MDKNRHVEKRQLSSKRSQFISGVLSLVLCFSMVPFAYAEESNTADDAFEGVAAWVTDVDLPASYEQVDWDSLRPGVDYVPNSMILTFMPKTPLEVGRALITAQGWTEDAIISWDDDAGWKCMSVTVPESQSLKDAMAIAAGSGKVWYSELNRISACPIDEEVSDLPDESIEAPLRQWPFDNQDVNLINSFENYSEKELYLKFDSDVSLEEALDTVFSMEGWSVGYYQGTTSSESSWFYDHELLVTIPSGMTVIDAKKIAKQQAGIADVELVYYLTTGPVYEEKPNIAITFDAGVDYNQATKAILGLGWPYGDATKLADTGQLRIEAFYPKNLASELVTSKAYSLEDVVHVELIKPSDSGSEDGSQSPSEGGDASNINIGDQWYLDYLGITDAWNQAQCNGAVSVAVLDTGVWAVPDLQANLDLDNAWDAVSESPMSGDPIHPHGTWVAGVISAQTDDDQGVSGVSHNAKIVPVNIASSVKGNLAYAKNDHIALAIEHVINSNDIDNLRVINISFGGRGEAKGSLQTAINHAVEKGVSVVCSAGNENTDALYTPSDLNNVISVIATTITERWVDSTDQSKGSCYGPAKDIAAPGYCIKTVSTDMDTHGIAYCTGTSFSAPIVSGVLALMYAANPNLTAADAEYYLENTATDLGEPGFDNEFANGLVNAKAAVLSVASEDALFTRLAGDYVVNTMDAIVSEGFLNGVYGDKNGSDTVIVATMDSYYDALTAASLAGIKNCPILLTDPETLSPETASLIGRLGVSKAYIVGGPSAVSLDVEQQISDLSGVNEVERLWGDYARDTAMAIYREGTREGAWGDTAIVCTVNSYLDGLAASPYSFAKGAPIFLVNSDLVLEDDALSAIASGGFKKVIVMGGTSAVSSAIGTQLFGVVNNISRMAGDDAYETARLFANRCLEDGMQMNGAAVTTAQSYYDALCAGPLCGRTNAPILYADEEYIESAETFFTTYAPFINRGYVLGGYSAVPKSVIQELKAAIAAAL